MSFLKTALKWALLYLAVGGAAKAIAYLTTGVAQFPIDWEETTAYGTLAFDVLGFLVFRSGIAVLVGISLAWCLSATATRRFAVLVVFLPLLCELILLRNSVAVWPSLGMNGLVVAMAYLAGPFVSGVSLAFAVMRVIKRTEPSVA